MPTAIAKPAWQGSLAIITWLSHQALRLLRCEPVSGCLMNDNPVPIRSFVILGLTSDGRRFRPSDWAERLCGVMSSFRPGSIQAHSHLGYSPYVSPGEREGVKCVVVDARIHGLEAMAYHFLVGFARDNDLQVIETSG
jgi:hypothetical protein